MINTTGTGKNNDEKGSFSQSVFEWAQAATVAVVAVVLLLTFVFRLVDVNGESMMDTLLSHDKVMVTNLFYTPKQGDVVVISHAENYYEPIIKRVIATEGQKVDIDFEKGIVYIDDMPIEEDYIKDKTYAFGDTEFPLTVQKGCVFVMGDNRPVSLDSRYTKIGQIHVSDIIGKAQFVVFPFDRMKYLY